MTQPDGVKELHSGDRPRSAFKAITATTVRDRAAVERTDARPMYWEHRSYLPQFLRGGWENMKLTIILIHIIRMARTYAACSAVQMY